MVKTIGVMRIAKFIAIALACAAFGCGPSVPPGPTWELYLAPPSKGAVVGYNYAAPVSEWRRANDRAYASLQECLAARADMLSAWSSEARGYARAGASSFGIQIDRLRSGQCLASNDPNLTIH
jgi:hypothetical protein